MVNGPRNLASCPFDFRNPFPLLGRADFDKLDANGPATTPVPHWPLHDDDATHFDYYVNDHAIVGLPGGPDCARIDSLGTVRGLLGAWGLADGDGRPFPCRIRRRAPGTAPDIVCELESGPLAWRWRWSVDPAPGLPSSDWLSNGQWVGGVKPQARNGLVRWSMEAANTGPSPVPIRLLLGWSQAPEISSGAFYSPQYMPGIDRASWREVSGRWYLSGIVSTDRIGIGALVAAGWRIARARDDLAHWPKPLSTAPKRHARSSLHLERILAPGATAGFTLTTPLLPVAPALLERSATVSTATSIRRTDALWRDRRAGRARLIIPEAKVAEAVQGAADHLDLCAIEIGSTGYSTPGASGGHHVFYDRDAPEMILAWDLLGDHARAERAFMHYELRNLGGIEEAGMMLWGLGEHHVLARDAGFPARALSLVRRGMATLIDRWQREAPGNQGLYAAHALADNELCRGRYLSHHLHAVGGARAAEKLARAAGETVLAKSYAAFHRRLRAHVLSALKSLARNTGGVATPTFEGFAAPFLHVDITWEDPPRVWKPAGGSYGATGGMDWQNLGLAWPFALVPVRHPIVTTSLARWRHAYVEGIFPYPHDADFGRLHNYNGICLSGTWLRRGDWAEAVRDLYGMLLHTSASHASAEVLDSRGRWDFGCTPHNWFSGRFLRFVRDCLVYEDGGDLHLLAGLSPAWMRRVSIVGVEDLPTSVGRFGFTARMRGDGFDLRLDRKGLATGAHTLLHLPPFLRGVRIENATQRRDGTWLLAAAHSTYAVRWKDDPLPDISFTRVVEAWLSDYRRRVEAGTGASSDAFRARCRARTLLKPAR